MRARFGRTLRQHMRDAELYTHPGNHVWSDTDAELADLFLEILRQEKTLSDEAILTIVADRCPSLAPDAVTRVWKRLQTFPYVLR